MSSKEKLNPTAQLSKDKVIEKEIAKKVGKSHRMLIPCSGALVVNVRLYDVMSSLVPKGKWSPVLFTIITLSSKVSTVKEAASAKPAKK